MMILDAHLKVVSFGQRVVALWPSASPPAAFVEQEHLLIKTVKHRHERRNMRGAAFSVAAPVHYLVVISLLACWEHSQSAEPTERSGHGSTLLLKCNRCLGHAAHYNTPVSERPRCPQYRLSTIWGTPSHWRSVNWDPLLILHTSPHLGGGG